MSTKFGDISVSEAKDLLREWREKNERRSDDVMDLWWNVLFGEDLGNEKHVILEQVIYASLDFHCAGVEWCLEDLCKDFPSSMRVLRYKALALESQEKYDQALEILDNIIKADETNAAARKRRVTIFKAKGQTQQAIIALVDYLKKFMSDSEAWQQLCELYLQEGELARAIFCAEELLLHQPHHHLLHQRVADIRYTMGGLENMELAKSYYCHALKLNPNNMRALLGLILVTNNLLTHYKASNNGNKRKEVVKLSQWAASEVARKQKHDSCSITQLISTLAITE